MVFLVWSLAAVKACALLGDVRVALAWPLAVRVSIFMPYLAWYWATVCWSVVDMCVGLLVRTGIELH